MGYTFSTVFCSVTALFCCFATFASFIEQYPLQRWYFFPFLSLIFCGFVSSWNAFPTYIHTRSLSLAVSGVFLVSFLPPPPSQEKITYTSSFLHLFAFLGFFYFLDRLCYCALYVQFGNSPHNVISHLSLLFMNFYNVNELHPILNNFFLSLSSLSLSLALYYIPCVFKLCVVAYH